MSYAPLLMKQAGHTVERGCGVIGIEVLTNKIESRIELGALALSPTRTTTVTLPADAVEVGSTAIIHVTFADGDVQDKEISVY